MSPWGSSSSNSGSSPECDRPPYVVAIVLNWNNLPDTLERVASLERSDYSQKSTRRQSRRRRVHRPTSPMRCLAAIPVSAFSARRDHGFAAATSEANGSQRRPKAAWLGGTAGYFRRYREDKAVPSQDQETDRQGPFTPVKLPERAYHPSHPHRAERARSWNWGRGTPGGYNVQSQRKTTINRAHLDVRRSSEPSR